MERQAPPGNMARTRAQTTTLTEFLEANNLDPHGRPRRDEATGKYASGIQVIG